MKLYEINMVYQHSSSVGGAIYFENIEVTVIATAEYCAQLINRILEDKLNTLLCLHVTPTGESADPDDIPSVKGVFD